MNVCKYVNHTFVSAAEIVLVDLLHPLQVDAADLRMVYHGLGVVNSNDAFCILLGFLWGPPGVVDVFGREVLQYWQKTSESKYGKKEVEGLELYVDYPRKAACDCWLDILHMTSSVPIFFIQPVQLRIDE